MKSLPASGRKYIDNNFLGGDFNAVTELESLAQETALPIDMKLLEKEIYWAMQKFDANDSQMDVAIAPGIHKIINISRKQASDYGIWRYLTTVKFKEFIRYRWSGSSGKVGFDRYWGYKRRNGFCRLWWAAELTVVNGNYELTEKLLSEPEGQDQYEYLVMGSKFSNYPNALIPLLEELVDEERQIYREVADNLNRLLTTVVLESLDREEVRNVVKSLIKAEKMGKKPHVSNLPLFAG